MATREKIPVSPHVYIFSFWSWGAWRQATAHNFAYTLVSLPYN